MRIFITGGAGFIGSHLTAAHLDRGDQVVILDDLSTGSANNFQPFKSNERFGYHIDSFTNVPLVTELVDGADIVYHLAAAVGVRLIVERPVRTIETNVRGTEIVLNCAAKKGKPTFIASTSEVYGKSLDLPFREDGDLTMGATSRSRWSYACSKALDEFLGLAYAQEGRVPAVVGRLFNTVGPRQTGRYGMVLPTFVRQALTEEPITVYGDGTQTRCFCHVSDVVRALIALMNDERSAGRVFNIGATEEVSILQLAERVKSRTASHSAIRLVPYTEAYATGFEDMMRRVPDTTRLEEAIGWKQTIPLDQIIDDVIADQRSRLGH